jgi:DNA-binding NarL/FixJ family response regulator
MIAFEAERLVEPNVRTLIIEGDGLLRTAMSGRSPQTAPHVIVLELRDRRTEQHRGGDPSDGAGRRICVVSRCGSPKLVSNLSENVDGCLITDMPAEAIIDALKAIARGAHVNDRAVLTAAQRRPHANRDRDPDALTPRETEVAHLIAEGLPNKAIATRLSISSKTVEAHITHIMEKLRVSARTQIAAHVFRSGLRAQ